MVLENVENIENGGVHRKPEGRRKGYFFCGTILNIRSPHLFSSTISPRTTSETDPSFFVTEIVSPELAAVPFLTTTPNFPSASFLNAFPSKANVSSFVVVDSWIFFLTRSPPKITRFPGAKARPWQVLVTARRKDSPSTFREYSVSCSKGSLPPAATRESEFSRSMACQPRRVSCRPFYSCTGDRR